MMVGANLQLTRCPECGRTAEIERRTVLASTAGPIEHAKIRCVNRHWCDVPLSVLEDVPRLRPARRKTGDRR